MVALDVPQGIVGNPVQLTVGKTTRLLLNATRDNKSSTHTIEGWLKYDSSAVPLQQVEEDTKRCSPSSF
jgi:hypothetical protein